MHAIMAKCQLLRRSFQHLAFSVKKVGFVQDVG